MLATIITCDRCGTPAIGANRKSLWQKLSRKGWKKGDKPHAFYCGDCADNCPAHQPKMEG